MLAVELTGLTGFKDLRVTEVEKPGPKETEALIKVKAAGINYAEVEQTRGRYPAPKALPFIMGFEAAGEVVEIGAQVTNLKIGDRITTLVSSGGFAEYATAEERFAIPIPNGISFAEATTIPVQGISAYALLMFAARIQPNESLLVQAAAGGVGLYLVQLAKIMGVRQIIALASSEDKLSLVKSLGADVAINYAKPGWTEKVLEATEGKGVDVVLEMASGDIGEESFKLLASFGRIVFFGARNAHDTLSSERVRQLIIHNQSLVGFNIPTLKPEQIGQCVAPLLNLIAERRLKLYAESTYPLSEVVAAFEALESRRTIGKVVLVP